MEDRLFLITERWKDSCTSMAYKKGTTKFKVVPQSLDLITLPPHFNERFKSVDYRTTEGIELDSSEGIYNTVLTPAQTMEHPAWHAAVEEDTSLLTVYVNIIFTELERKCRSTMNMGFYVRQNTPADELRALYIHDLVGYSYAIGSDDLVNTSSFIRIAPRAP